MGDIDFDELDKAVNSLMSSSDAPAAHKKSTTRQQAPKATAVHRRHTLAAGRVSAKPKPAPKVAKKAMDVRFTQNKPAATQAPAARRSGGRFMDVVDSSSELNPIRKPITPPREIPRKIEQVATEPEAPVVKPVTVQSTVPSLAPIVTETATQTNIPERDKPVIDESATEAVQVRLVAKSTPTSDPLQLLHEEALVSAVEIVKSEQIESDDIRPAAVFGGAVSPVAPSSSDNQPVAVTVRPKPLTDLSGPVPMPTWQQEQHPNIIKESTQSAESDNVSPIAINYAAKQEEPDAALELATQPNADKEEPELPENESPFLTDAKIDKRPLNANPTVANEPVEPIRIELPTEKDIPTVEPEPAVDDLMPIMPHEQPEVSEIPELSSELVALEATGKGEYELDEPPVPIKSSTDGSQKAELPKKETPTGPTSIAQQYESKESSGDASHAPIYDASEYAEPVTHPAKKKSGWIWVLVIFLILAIASGGAVALYLTGIIP